MGTVFAYREGAKDLCAVLPAGHSLLVALPLLNEIVLVANKAPTWQAPRKDHALQRRSCFATLTDALPAAIR
jgi:hypothetical protein